MFRRGSPLFCLLVWTSLADIIWVNMAYHSMQLLSFSDFITYIALYTSVDCFTKIVSLTRNASFLQMSFILQLPKPFENFACAYKAKTMFYCGKIKCIRIGDTWRQMLAQLFSSYVIFRKLLNLCMPSFLICEMETLMHITWNLEKN